MFKHATSFLRENSGDFYSLSSVSISLEAYTLREIPQLEKKSDFWNQLAFSEELKILSRGFKKTFGGKSVNILDCEASKLTLW